MAEFRSIPNALAPAEFGALRDALLGSPFVAKSTLGGTFQASRGFGVAFTSEGRADLIGHIGELAPFLARAIDGAAEQSLRSFWSRGTVELPNAWYLNLLLVGAGGGVGPHIDATLAAAAAVPDATPRVVSVLYLQVPQTEGGELVLAREKKLVGVVHPTVGTLLHFRGDLEHQVRALENATEGAVRASLVLEQYRFEPDALERLPPLRIDSRAKFGLALAEAAKRPLPKFEVER